MQYRRVGRVCRCGWAALAVAAGRPPARLISIAPPVNIFDFTPVPRPACPWLVIQGGADEIVPVSAVREWVMGQQPAPVFAELPDAGHFFHGRLNQLREVLLKELSASRSVQRT